MSSSMAIFMIFAVMLIIVLIDSIIKQQTIAELINNLSLGMLSSQVNEQAENTCGESYRNLPPNTILYLANGNPITINENGARLYETKTDIILQMSSGDLFIVPDGTTISIPHEDGSPQVNYNPHQVHANNVLNTANKSVAPGTANTTTAAGTNAPTTGANNPPTLAGVGAPGSSDVKSTFIGGGRYEGFNNELEEEKKITNLTDDYMQDLLNLGLENSVRQQHKDYANERNRITNTATMTSVRDDEQDIIGWVGLKRPDYTGVNYDPRTARTLPSTEIADLPQQNKNSWFK